MTFERFAVVRVPFPFSDRNTTKNRLAVVLSDATAFNIPAGHPLMAIITSQDNPPWPLDYFNAGSPLASIRTGTSLHEVIPSREKSTAWPYESTTSDCSGVARTGATT